MGSSRRIRAIGQFCWQDADVGVECRRCGRVRVYCDWEAERCFKERGWSISVEDAPKRLRCPCGSGDVRLIPVPIWKRPQPLPVRPEALRPIYSEDERSLRRRGRSVHARADRIEEALVLLRQAVDDFPGIMGVTPQTQRAVELLRPLVYHGHHLDELLDGLGRDPHPLTKRQQVDMPFKHILRQLGRRLNPPEGD